MPAQDNCLCWLGSTQGHCTCYTDNTFATVIIFYNISESSSITCEAKNNKECVMPVLTLTYVF